MKKIIKQKVKGNDRHWKNFIDKNYLGSHNLEKDEEMLLTIEKFEGEELVLSATETEFDEQGKRVAKKIPKQVLYFKEPVPKMIMNITNGTTIAFLYGNHPKDWIGKQILIYATKVQAFGKNQDALRVRDIIPKITVDNSLSIKKLNEAKTLIELQSVWKSLSVVEQKDPKVLGVKNELKTKLK